MKTFERFLKDTAGANLWEYALGIAVGLGVVTALFLLRDRIREVFVTARNELNW
jgi:Flp pilus assembly pilin Flp